MNNLTPPLGCTHCGATRRNHDADDHRYQVPDMDTILDRAAAYKQRRAAA